MEEFDAEAELAKIANEMCHKETEKFMEELMIGLIRNYESKYCGIAIKDKNNSI